MRREVRQIVVVRFDRYHPLNKTVSAEVRAGAPLKWIRWDVDSHRDPVLLDLPREGRWIWPVLLALAGKEPRQPDGARVIHMTPTQLAREADLTEVQVEHALDYLLRHERIRVSRGKGGADHREGGADHREGGYVPTYRRTHERTNEQTESVVGRLERLEGEVENPEIRTLLGRKRKRLMQASA